MKNLKMSVAAMLLMVVSLGFSQETAKMGHDHSKMDMSGMNMDEMQMAPEFSDDNLANAYGHYVHIKTALVGSNSNEVKKGAAMLSNSLKKVEGSEAAGKAVKKIESAADLKSQRIAFSSLSDEMAVLVEGNLKSGMIYKDFCPMALGGGAYWLSSEKEIQNPYFGDKMLKCGSVKEIIN
ncbi:MAG: DUF3347 domain-containing protein [Flavobacteriaceae bacterium]|nr:DUF3347 domain-containing protein [Flavobacteriaceae bacterium]